MVAAFSRIRPGRAVLGIAAAAFAVLVGAAPALANVTLTKILSDPFTNGTSQHATVVEPDMFSFGTTIVAAAQSGRFFDGGSSDIGFATSTNSGSTWTSGTLPGTTPYSTPAGPYARVSDPSVAFDRRHGVWLISSLPLIPSGTGVTGSGVIVSRSITGGATWGNPVPVQGSAPDSGTDKDWITCDNTPTSHFYGNCYVEWDLNSAGNLIQMSTSTDGGVTWGPKQTPQPILEAGIGGEPVVQPNGNVIVPIDNANETAVGAFMSTDGGASWTDVTTIALIKAHVEAGNLRSGPLPSAAIDGAGNVYVFWSDCRFRKRCPANDIVYSKSSNGTTWSAITRVPIDSTSSGVDHFLPGLGVDTGTSGGSAHLGLAYYFYPVSNCSASTCRLDVGFISSTNGGGSWGTATQLAGPMTLSWLAATSQGQMVGDYFSTSFAAGTAHPALVVANAPTGGTFDEALYTTASGLRGGSLVGEVAGRDQIPAGIYSANGHAAHSWH